LAKGTTFASSDGCKDAVGSQSFQGYGARPRPLEDGEPNQTPTGQLLSSRLTDTSHGYGGEMISHLAHVRIGGFVGESRPLHPPISEEKIMTLAEQHEKMLLEESGISPEVVEARGYRTVDTKSELKRLGFSERQCNKPALLFPVHSPSDEVMLYQSRPDEPRIKDGKAIKYETPSGSRMTIDVHPFMREKLGDPSVPLWITEGIKKGDSLTSRGLCTATLLGVWNWRGTNEHGGKTALPEWEYIALEERKVYVVFDSEVMVKSQVHKALSRLRGFLESRGAEVHVIYLPHGEGGKKQGVDDFFVAGHGVDDLFVHATQELREPPRDDENGEPAARYRSTSQGLVWDKPTRHGTSPTPLTNFVAEIVSDVVEDDGAEERHTFEIEAQMGGRVRRFEVPAASFASMGWVARHLGASAFVYPGWGYEKHAAVAIQSLSGEITERRYFTHTGWREIEGEWAYLHAGGAIGPKGPLTGVEVAMGDGRLGDFVLPEPPENAALVEAVRASLRLLNLASPEVAYPLLAAVYRAALGEAVPLDLSVHLAGPTGAFKTELTAITQAHYGSEFNGRSLPGNWSSTENTLEKQAFLLKDAVFTVDDFAPTGTTADIARLHRTADRLLRAQGNRSGRGRMRPDGSLRPQYYPRGLILSSGEDMPRGQSLRARMLISEISPGDVDLSVLTEMQRAAAEGLLAGAMSGYVRYLAPLMGGLKESLPARQKELRAIGVGAHARTPDVVASLALGLETFLQFATEVGAVTKSEAGETWDAGWEALVEAASAQAEHQSSEEPTQQFRELLEAAIGGGDAYLANAQTDEKPENPGRWGWRYGLDEWRPRGKRIGWLAGDGSLLLEPGVAFAMAQRTAREQGTALPVNKRTMWKRLHEKGLLASREVTRGRNTSRATIDGNRKIVIHLIPGALLPEDDPNGPNGPPPDERGGSGPKMRAVLPPPPSETAPNNGLEPAENDHTGPKGPKGPLSDEVPRDGAQQGSSHDAVHPNLNGDAQLVRTEADLQALAEKLQSAERVALDLETTGLDPREDRVRILSLTISQGTWLIDCFEVDPRPLFPILADKELIAHNAVFELTFLTAMGFEFGEGSRVGDTMLMSQLLRGQSPGKEGK
jgi:hypothetical protein